MRARQAACAFAFIAAVVAFGIATGAATRHKLDGTVDITVQPPTVVVAGARHEGELVNVDFALRNGTSQSIEVLRAVANCPGVTLAPANEVGGPAKVRIVEPWGTMPWECHVDTAGRSGLSTFDAAIYCATSAGTVVPVPVSVQVAVLPSVRVEPASVVIHDLEPGTNVSRDLVVLDGSGRLRLAPADVVSSAPRRLRIDLEEINDAAQTDYAGVLMRPRYRLKVRYTGARFEDDYKDSITLFPRPIPDSDGGLLPESVKIPVVVRMADPAYKVEPKRLVFPDTTVGCVERREIRIKAKDGNIEDLRVVACPSFASIHLNCNGHQEASAVITCVVPRADELCTYGENVVRFAARNDPRTVCQLPLRFWDAPRAIERSGGDAAPSSPMDDPARVSDEQDRTGDRYSE